jgi:hypothetical protein
VVISPQIKEQFLPARAALLEDFWKKTVEKWRFAEVDYSNLMLPVCC